MKRSILAAIVGLGTVVSSFGQGQILVSNYLTPPYNQVYFTANNQAVNDSSLTFQLLYGKGTISDVALLTAGVTFSIDTSLQFTPDGGTHGAGGYFANVVQVLPTWVAGDTFTFAYTVTSAGYTGTSALWQETASIKSSAVDPSTAVASFVPGLGVSVPEPSTFALAGLGSAALFIFRRRK